MARASSIKLSINFAPLLEKIQEAGGDVEKATLSVAKKSANIVEQELKNACNAKNVSESISREIDTTVEKVNSNLYTCKVGWKLGAYNPKKLSAGYKAVFLNYGTPARETKSGANRGKIEARGFIEDAKKDANKKVKKIQEEALNEMLKGLK